MTESKTSRELSNKTEGLATLLIGLDKGRVSAVELFKEIVADGQKEGYSVDELKALAKEACIRRGLSDRTYYLYLSAELKNPKKVKAGQTGGLAATIAAKVDAKADLEAEIAYLEQENAKLKEQLRQKDIRIAELEEALIQLPRPILISKGESS